MIPPEAWAAVIAGIGAVGHMLRDGVRPFVRVAFLAGWFGWMVYCGIVAAEAVI